MNRKIIYLINPISGVGKKPQLKTAIIKRTTDAGINFEIADTKKDGDYSYLRNRIAQDQITDVIICGGDGSVSTVTAYLLNTTVTIGIIPMGSGNGLALAAGIPNSVNRALDIIISGRSTYIDGFFINDKFSCMMCGMGNDAQVAHDFSMQKTRGLKTYLKLSALNYFKSKSYSFTIQIGERSFNTDAYFIVIANSNQFGNNVTIAPRASLNDGLLDIVVVKKMSKLMLPFALLRQITGINAISEKNHHRHNKNILYFQTPAITIINNDNAPLHIDGEPEPATQRIYLKILPNAFRLLQPLH